MNLGCLLPQFGTTWAETLAAASEAEEQGFHSVWLGGHISPMEGIGEMEDDTMEPWVSLAGIAALTNRVRLGILVVPLPYYLPAIVAKMASQLDHVSSGRFDLGVGTGWSPREFSLVRTPFLPISERIEQLEEGIEQIRSLWTATGELTIHPAPVQQPSIPLWIGGKGPKMLDTVARHADAANFARGTTVSEFGRLSEQLSEIASGYGRPTPKLTLTAAMLVAEDDAVLETMVRRRAARRSETEKDYLQRVRTTGTIIGTPDQCVTQIQAYVRAGCEYLIALPFDKDRVGQIRTIGSLLVPLLGNESTPSKNSHSSTEHRGDQP